MLPDCNRGSSLRCSAGHVRIQKFQNPVFLHRPALPGQQCGRADIPGHFGPADGSAGEAGLHQITYNDYEEKVENGDAFIVIIERAGCSYCVQYMPIVEEVANEKKIPIYYIDTDTLSQDEYTELSTTNNYLKRNDWGTPTTLFMLGERVLDSIGGYVEKDAVLSFIDGKVVVGE